MISITKKDMLRKDISIRNVKSIDFETFVADMDLDDITGDNLDDMVEALKIKMFMHQSLPSRSPFAPQIPGSQKT